MLVNVIVIVITGHVACIFKVLITSYGTKLANIVKLPTDCVSVGFPATGVLGYTTRGQQITINDVIVRKLHTHGHSCIFFLI